MSQPHTSGEPLPARVVEAQALDLFDAAHLDELREVLDPEDFVHMFAEVPTAATAAWEELGQAFAVGDAEGVRVAAHALKGLAASIGAARLSEMAHLSQKFPTSATARARLATVLALTLEALPPAGLKGE